MKVGDYVRTKKRTFKPPQIARIKSMQKDSGYYNQYYIVLDRNLIPDYEFCIYEEDIEKSSPNILELLEEHDFITIEYYSLRYDERVERIFEVDYKDEEFTTLKNAYCDFMLKNNEFNNSDKALEPIIKSILTKEQFESMEYKVC